MKNKNHAELKEKITQLNNETNFYLSKIKEYVANIKQNQKMNVVSYFTFSFSISHDNEQDSLIIGTYHIHNLGNKLLTNPYICIILSPDSLFSFSGKYINKKNNVSMKAPGAWERLNEQTDKKEYWLRPLENQIIEPSQAIAFPNFQVKWLPKESYSGSIMGFTYSDELNEGIPAINQIYLNSI